MTKPKLRFKEFNDKWINTNIKNISLLLKDGTHGSYNDTIDGIPLLSAKDIENGKIQIPCDCRRISLKDYNDIFKNYKLEINDILLTIVGTIGRLAIIENTTEKYAFQRSVAIIRINQENNPKFILYILQTNNVKKQFYARVNQSAQGGIYLDTLGKTNIVLPCFEEQEKIAGFLSKVDELINECEGELKDLEEQKKGLMQKIFSQQIRFKDSNNNPYPEWEEKVMNDILNEYCKKNSISNQYPVLTSSKQGLMLQTEYYSGENRITEKDNIGFNIIPPNYITYRSRSDDGLFTFNINNLGVTGIVSTYYPVFSTNYNNLFVMTYLNINKNNLFKYAVGSSQKVLSLNELKKVKIKLPYLEEQEKIAKVLSKMDELIEEKKALLSDWQQFKKGLLQQMFV